MVDGVDDSAVDDPASVSALGALRKGSFEPVVDAVAPPHTLLLGTQPSDNSLEHGRYFMTNQNAFWWIVGDALGFRRDFHIGARGSASIPRIRILRARRVSVSLDVLASRPDLFREIYRVAGGRRRSGRSCRT